jgi:hypothetical protein
MTGKHASPLLRWYHDAEYETVIDVYIEFKNEFIKELINNEEGVTLPHNLGWLKILGNKNAAIDRFRPHKLKQSGNENYHKNFHTDGWVFKVFWYSNPVGKSEDIIKRGFFNSDAYGFKPSTLLKKSLLHKIMAGEWDHYHKKSFRRAPRTNNKRGRPTNASLKEKGLL